MRSTLRSLSSPKHFLPCPTAAEMRQVGFMKHITKSDETCAFVGGLALVALVSVFFVLTVWEVLCRMI